MMSVITYPRLKLIHVSKRGPWCTEPYSITDGMVQVMICDMFGAKPLPKIDIP